MAAPNVLIMGVGNVLRGDEGVGVHAVRLLERRAWPGHVSLVDGGTGGFRWLSQVSSCDVLILIDAILDERRPGTVAVLEPACAAEFPRALSAYDSGLKDLVECAELLGLAPHVQLVTVSVARLQPAEMTLSPEVEASLPAIVAAVVDLTARRAWRRLGERDSAAS